MQICLHPYYIWYFSYSYKYQPNFSLAYASNGWYGIQGRIYDGESFHSLLHRPYFGEYQLKKQYKHIIDLIELPVKVTK